MHTAPRSHGIDPRLLDHLPTIPGNAVEFLRLCDDPSAGVKDIAAARSVLEARGVEFDGETAEIPGLVKLASFRDPDGNALMLAESLSD